MSESVAKPRTMIDLDEFERRLRRPSAGPRADGDPLAELARLVGGRQDPLDSVFKEPVPPRVAAEPALAPRHDEQWMFPRPGAAQPQANPRPHPLAGDFAAIEAGLRGSIPPETAGFSAGARSPAHAQANLPVPAAGDFNDMGDDFGADYGSNLGEDLRLEAGWDQNAQVYAGRADLAEPSRPRSRRPLYITAAVILIGIAGIGASFALKGTAGRSLGEVAVIRAADGPTKVQADNSASDVPDQNASILDKGPQPTPVALVNRSEQPVDLSQTNLPQSADRAARVITLGNAQMASGAANVPVPPSPGQASPSGTMPMGVADLIEPRKVKTISVRPDGSLLPNDATAQAASDAPVPPPRPAPGAAAAKASTPKTAARVVTTPKTPAAASQDAGRTAAQDRDDSRPIKVASAETDATDTAPGTTKGAFAVQLAAPGTESEARQSAVQLGKQYASVLGGQHLTFHRASVDGKPVYRVRVGGLSHDEATALCEKLKAGGGKCFVAKN